MDSPKRLRVWLVVGAATVGAALGGAAIAGAATSSSSVSTPATSNAPAGAPANRPDPATLANGPGETLLTGTTAEQVKAAALASVPGGRIIRVETDSAGSPYEAHVKKADGTEVTVKVDANFKVTATEQGFGAGPHGGRAPAGFPGAGPHDGQAPAGFPSGAGPSA